MVVDVGRLFSLHAKWEEALPKICPFYAVKCNEDKLLLKTLAALGTGFDCASKVSVLRKERHLEFQSKNDYCTGRSYSESLLHCNSHSSPFLIDLRPRSRLSLTWACLLIVSFMPTLASRFHIFNMQPRRGWNL